MIDSERVEEILEGQLENKNSGDSITTKKELSERTEREGVGEEDIYAETSTGSGRVAMPREYLQNIGRGAFRTMGVGNEDVILNLGAPQPHLSGIGMKVSGEAAGAEVLTLHAGEVDEIMDRAEEVTTVVSLPGMAKAKGQEVQEKYGDPSEVFNPDTALLAGEIITESWRENLSEQWGFNNTNEIYASSEAGPIFAELDSPETQRKLLPQLDEAVIEVYPLGSEERPQEINSEEVDPEELVDIREIDEKTEGVMYPTVPSMFTRYDQGDLVQVWPGESMNGYWPDEIPAVEPLGRIDCLNLAGAMVPEGKIERTLNEAYDGSAVEWTARATGPRENSTLEIYTDKGIPEERFYSALEEHAHDIFYAEKHDMMNSVEVHEVEDPFEHVEESEGLKTNRMEDRR